MTRFDLIIGLIAAATASAAVVTMKKNLALHVEILRLALLLKKEQRLTTSLREMLSKVGVETIVTPTSGDYALTFKAHFPPPNITSALRGRMGTREHPRVP